MPAAATLTPTPAPIEMPTSIPTVVIVAPAVPDLAAATPLPAIPADAVEAQVLRVIDGETIEVRIVEEVGPEAVHRSSPSASILTNFRTASIGDVSIFGWRPRLRGRVAQVETVELVMIVRYADIEAPELDTIDGLAAAAANRELVEGQTVFLEFVDLEPDADGAIPAYAFLPDGELVNAALVLQGHAVVAPSVADSKYEERLLDAETQAQESGNGMWALAPTLPEEVIATLEAAVASDTPAAAEPPPEAATASPAPTDTQPPESAASSPCVQLVRNGSFEEGDVYWNLIEGASPPVITSDVAFGEGGQSLRLGIVDGENVASISAADQLVELPADAYSIVLSVRYRPIIDGEPGPGDLQYIDIYNAMTGQFAVAY